GGAARVDVAVARFRDRYRQLEAEMRGFGWVNWWRLDHMQAEFAALVGTGEVGDHVGEVLGSDEIGHVLEIIQTGLDQVPSNDAAFLVADALWAASLVPRRGDAPSRMQSLRVLSPARLAVLLDFIAAALAKGVDPLETPELRAIGYNPFEPMPARWARLKLVNSSPSMAKAVRDDGLFDAELNSPVLIDALYATDAAFTTSLTISEPVAGVWHPVFGQLPTIGAQLLFARRLADDLEPLLARGGPGSLPEGAHRRLARLQAELDRIDGAARAVLDSGQAGLATQAELANLSGDWVRALNSLAALAGM